MGVLRWIRRVMLAITFAEAGEFSTAKAVLRRRRKDREWCRKIEREEVDFYYQDMLDKWKRHGK